MAALKRPDRVISICLTITTSLLEKLFTIKGALSELQDLLLSRDGVPLTLPSTFRWSQRLRRLHMTGIALPTLPHLLTSSTDLIDLQFHDVFLPWQFPPKTFMEVLSKLGQLRSLSLHFSSTADYHHSLLPYLEGISLPVLTTLNYRGSMAYLEGIVAMIDAPLLVGIEITFFDHPVLALSKLNNFINQIDIYRSHCGAHMFSSEPTISISLIQPEAPMFLKLEALCKPLRRIQISSIVQICLKFSPFLFDNKGNPCDSTTRQSEWMNSSHSRELLELLIGLFTGKGCFTSIRTT